MKVKGILVLFFMAGGMIFASTSAKDAGVTKSLSVNINEPASTRTERLAEWEGLKYGIFIHFGMSTFTGYEIDEGKSPSTIYAPVKLDVRQWIKTAKDAGMKYAMLTGKHVAGHCLWDSKYTDYDVATSSNKADVVAEFMAACKAEGIKPCIYYCIMDGHNNDDNDKSWTAPIKTEKYFEFVKNQLTELHTKYPDIYEQWIDIPKKLNATQRGELYSMIKKLNPQCVILMNQGFQDGVNVPTDQWPTDLVDGERSFPPITGHNPLKSYNGKTYYLPMEVCQTIGDSWFWEANDVPKSTRTLYGYYCSSAGRGANLLLNVPPDNTGRINAAYVKALMELKKVIDNPALLPKPKSLTYGRGIKASSMYWKSLSYFDPNYATDEDLVTRWAASKGQKQAWLEVDLGKEATFDRAFIAESRLSPDVISHTSQRRPKDWKNVTKFELQGKYDGQWKTFAEGTQIGELELKFAPVKARYVRLNILDAAKTPSIAEFQLFASKD